MPRSEKQQLKDNKYKSITQVNNLDAKGHLVKL
jgi:hypothetical protein